MRKQLSTTFSALDEITSTSLDPNPSLGSVLLRGDQSRMVESLLSRLATNPSSTASSSSAATSHRHAAPPAPHSYSDVMATTMTGPPRPTPVPPQLPWAPAAAICYPYRSPPPQPHYYPPPQQYHDLYPNAAHLPLQHHHHQQPAQHPHHPQPQRPQAPSWFIPPEHQERPAVISSHIPPFVDANLIWVAPSHHVALQPQNMWRPTEASMATSVVGGTSSSSPSSPFASSPFTSSTSSLHVFSPGRSSSLENVGDLGGIDDSSAVIASFLAGDASDDDGRSPPAAAALHNEKRRRLESGQRSTSPISDGRGLAAPYAGRMAHGHGETGKRKTSDYTQQLQNVENDWFGMTESPDSAFFTGSTSSLPLQLFGATSSFSLSPPAAGAAVSSLPSPSSPPQHCLPTYGDPTSPCVASSSPFFRHPEAAEAGPTEEGWPSTKEDAGIRSCASVRPVLDGGQPPAASSP